MERRQLNTMATMDGLLQELSRGMFMNKVKSGGVCYRRLFAIDCDKMQLYYSGSKKRIRKKTTFWPLFTIQEVREGEKDYAKRLDSFDRFRIFCVRFGANHEVLYLLTDSYDDRNKWMSGLRYLLQLEKYLQQKEQSNRWIREAFEIADKNGDNALDFEEILKLLKTLNADMEKTYVKKMFDAADTRKSNHGKPTLDREEFVNFYHNLTERPEIKKLYGWYSCNKGYLTSTDLQRFFTEEQKEENMTEKNCRELIAVYEPQKENKEQERMSFIGFRHLLISSTQHLFKWRHRRVYQDMTQPMTNYFINSSHNTYLAEDQLKGPSRVECYITALKKGCRCVELDCYDGSNDEPVIYHGYTLTSKILFRDVIAAIKDYAFVASPYPVTLSIENHCSKEQQEVMADILTETLGNLLYAPDVLPNSPPSPQQLKEKIIVKGKKLPFRLNQSSVIERGSSLEEGEVSDEDEASEVQDDMQQSQQEEKHQKLGIKFSKSVGMKSVSFKGCDQPPTGSENFNVVSLAEKKIEKLLENDPEGVCKYARSTLIRTYPAGSRTDSSNYNPVPMWCGGCQIVALNFQTGGLEMQLLHGMFLDNGNCGYVLKPNCLRADDAYQAVLGRGQSTTRKCLDIQVISGFQLPKPKNSKKGEVIDPFLKIEIHGAKIDVQERKTSVIKNNGFNPNWNEKFTFHIEVPELALVRFALYDKDPYFDDFIGFYVVPVNSLQQGYRHFPLFDQAGEQYPQAVMFVHVQVTDGWKSSKLYLQ